MPKVWRRDVRQKTFQLEAGTTLLQTTISAIFRGEHKNLRDVKISNKSSVKNRDMIKTNENLDFNLNLA